CRPCLEESPVPPPPPDTTPARGSRTQRTRPNSPPARASHPTATPRAGDEERSMFWYSKRMNAPIPNRLHHAERTAGRGGRSAVAASRRKTNVFGAVRDLRMSKRICQARGRSIRIDSARGASRGGG